MRQPLRILLLEDRRDDARLILHQLRKAGFEPIGERVETESEFLAQLDTAPDLIVADYHQPQFDAVRALRLARERGLDVPVIVVTGDSGEEAAAECLNQGAYDYLLKDRLARLGQAVTHALARKQAGVDRLRVQETFSRQALEFARSQAELLDQTRILNSILDSIGDGVVVADENGSFLVFNTAAEQILGVGRTVTTPDQWSSTYGCYLPDQVTVYPSLSLPLARAIRGEAVDSAEMFIHHAGGPPGISVNGTAQPIYDEEGRLKGGLIVLTKITALTRAEQEIRNLKAQLAALRNRPADP